MSSRVTCSRLSDGDASMLLLSLPDVLIEVYSDLSLFYSNATNSDSKMRLVAAPGGRNSIVLRYIQTLNIIQ